MINRVVLVGRLTRDVEVRKTQSGISVASFTVACDRRFSSQNQQNQQQSADFISCVAWRQTADFLGSYARKGALVGVDGRLQSRSYDDRDGKKVYVTEVVANNLSLISSGTKKSSSAPAAGNVSLTRDDISKSLNETNLFDTGPDVGITGDDLPF